MVGRVVFLNNALIIMAVFVRFISRFRVFSYGRNSNNNWICAGLGTDRPLRPSGLLLAASVAAVPHQITRYYSAEVKKSNEKKEQAGSVLMQVLDNKEEPKQLTVGAKGKLANWKLLRNKNEPFMSLKRL